MVVNSGPSSSPRGVSLASMGRRLWQDVAKVEAVRNFRMAYSAIYLSVSGTAVNGPESVFV